MLYLGSSHAIPLMRGEAMSVEEVDPAYSAVMQWFPVPHVYFIGAHTGCSCGFPHVIMPTEPIEYYEGMFDSDDPEVRREDLRSAEELVSLLVKHTIPGAPLLLYAVWNGDEGNPPRGVIHWQVSGLDAKTLVLNERFMYEVSLGR